MRIIDVQELAALSAAAASRPRRRLNINLHADSDDSVQRMVIAFAPGTYIRPHRHPRQFETFIVLSGRVSLLIFGDKGAVEQRIVLSQASTRVVEIPPGTWHSLVSEADDTQVVEIKPGPYQPTQEHDFGPWAPPEGDLGAEACRVWMQSAGIGEHFQQ